MLPRASGVAFRGKGRHVEGMRTMGLGRGRKEQAKAGVGLAVVSIAGTYVLL